MAIAGRRASSAIAGGSRLQSTLLLRLVSTAFSSKLASDSSLGPNPTAAAAFSASAASSSSSSFSSFHAHETTRGAEEFPRKEGELFVESCRHKAAKDEDGDRLPFLLRTVTQFCSSSAEGLLWAVRPIRNVMSKGQARQSRYTSSLSSKYRPAFPDLSVGTSTVNPEDKVDPFALVEDELAMLGHNLRSMVSAEVPRLAEAAEYFFKRGAEGKHFRPMVLLLMASSLTEEGTRQNPGAGAQRGRQQQIAEITEMIHVASLLHDDVLDDADTRRGIGSLNHLMGNKLAVLAGDFLLSRASVALASLHNLEVVELLSKVLEHLVTGEIMQLTTETQEICSMEYYMQKTYYKTASLMANSCKSIAILSEQPREVANLAYEYGRHLGLAFQLVDDSLDFIGSKATLGKPTLSDLVQGIATAPVLFALEEHPRIYDLVKRKFGRSGDVDQALEMVRNSRGIWKTQQLATHHARQAALAVANLPSSPSERVTLCRRALTELTEQVVTRSK